MLESLRNKLSSSAKKKLKKTLIIAIPILLFVGFLMFYLDDELYYHYLKQEVSPIENHQENLETPVYDISDVKFSNKKTANADGTYDVSGDEVTALLNEILGNYGIEWVKGDTNMPDNVANHIYKALPMLISMNLKYKIFTSTGIIQSGIETGWGRATPPNSNNYFGIKGGGVAPTPYWNGDTVATASGEGEGANYSVQVSKFRVYESLYHSIMDYGYFFHANKIYTTGGIQQLGLSGDDANVFLASDGVNQLKRIMNAGYATAPNSYIINGEWIYKSYDLKRFDDIALKVAEALSNESGDGEFQDGEWTPVGDTNWLKELGINTSELSSKRIKVLNEAYALKGTYYRLVRPWKLPPKNPDGSYAITDDYVMEPNTRKLPYYLDCSAFTHEVYNQSLGVKIGDNTWGQLENNNLETIKPTEAKPGDIWLPHSGHVVIFLKRNPNGTNTYIHSPQTFANGVSPPRGRVTISTYAYNGIDKGTYRRLKGID